MAAGSVAFVWTSLDTRADTRDLHSSEATVTRLRWPRRRDASGRNAKRWTSAISACFDGVYG